MISYLINFVLCDKRLDKQTQSCIETDMSDRQTDRQTGKGRQTYRQRDGQLQTGRETTRRTDRQNGPIKQIVLIVTWRNIDEFWKIQASACQFRSLSLLCQQKCIVLLSDMFKTCLNRRRLTSVRKCWVRKDTFTCVVMCRWLKMFVERCRWSAS